RRMEEFELFWGRGRREARDIVRATGSFLARDRRFGPTRLDPGAPEAFAGGEENLAQRRAAIDMVWWRAHFLEVSGVERLEGVEDVDVGTAVAVRAGLAPRLLGSSADEGYGAARLETGATLGPVAFARLAIGAESRIRRELLERVLRTEA